MNKAPLMSMHKKWVDLIKKGLKTRELRTWIPKGYVGTVFVVSTKSSGGSGKVELSFWFDEYDVSSMQMVSVDSEALVIYSSDYKITNSKYDLPYFTSPYEYRLYEKSCVTVDEYKKYSRNGENIIYLWHIKKLEIFDEPKSLSNFYKCIDGLDEDGNYILTDIKVNIPQLRKKYLVQKAPQKMAWVYANERE